MEYASVASDGEAVQGTYAFDYDGPVTPAPAGWVPPSDGPDPQLVAQLEAAESPDEATAGDRLPGGQDQGEVMGAAPTTEGSVAPAASGTDGPGVQPGVYVVVGLGLVVVVGSVLLVARRDRVPGPDGSGGGHPARSGNPAVRARAGR